MESGDEQQRDVHKIAPTNHADTKSWRVYLLILRRKVGLRSNVPSNWALLARICESTVRYGSIGRAYEATKTDRV